MKSGIIVCTRLDSTRIPGKCAIKINGETILSHLHKRLIKFNTKIIYAVPSDELSEYLDLTKDFEGDFNVFVGPKSDPLKRMNEAAKMFKLDVVCRVTHDKIFLCENDYFKCLDTFHKKNLDYLFSTDFTPGTSMEFISAEALERAANKFKDVEHISYSIKAITENQYNMALKGHNKNRRLLIDFPEDIDVITAIMSVLGNDCTLEDVLYFMDNNEWCAKINKKPKVTVYTCCFNHEQYINQCMESVASQRLFSNYEYLLIDDKSSDKSSLLMAEFASRYPNVKYIRNNENMGLASSSNIALSKARGDYIIRLDSDDYFLDEYSIESLHNEVIDRELDAIYPNNYLGEVGKIQKGKDYHHCGGTLYNTKAINHVKFSEGLRNYEGLDLFHRAKNQIKIGYFNKPIYFYRQTPNSMSKTNLTEREKIKGAILGEARL